MANGKRSKGKPDILGFVSMPTVTHATVSTRRAPNAVPAVPPNPFSENLVLPPREEAKKNAVAATEAFEAKFPSESITMRIPGKTLLAAKAIAEKKGVGYQTYLKMLIHEGLERDKGMIERNA